MSDIVVKARTVVRMSGQAASHYVSLKSASLANYE